MSQQVGIELKDKFEGTLWKVLVIETRIWGVVVKSKIIHLRLNLSNLFTFFVTSHNVFGLKINLRPQFVKKSVLEAFWFSTGPFYTKWSLKFILSQKKLWLETK